MSVRRNYCWKIKQSSGQLKHITGALHMIPSLKLSLSVFPSLSPFLSVLFSLFSHILRQLVSSSLKVTATLVIKAVDVKPEVAS